MQNIRRIASVAAAALIAASSGYMVLRQPVAVAVEVATALPPASVLAPAEAMTAAPVLPALPQRQPPHENPAPDTQLVAAPTCANATFVATPAASAMLALSLSAPCMPGARVELRQLGLSFVALTDADGQYSGQLPALARDARVQALLPDGTLLAATAQISGLEAVERTVLLAGASAALHLDAFENGAGFGQPGHRSATAPGAPGTGSGGYLTLLGDATASPPMLAEVYTGPADVPPAQLAVRGDVTPATCGTDLRATVLRMGAPAPLPLALAMPACDGIDGAVLLPLPEAPLALASVDQR